MGRKILFITTDQQRYDTVGTNGGLLSRTPVLDRLAAEGELYDLADDPLQRVNRFDDPAIVNVRVTLSGRAGARLSER
jgi:hypothetical protein